MEPERVSQQCLSPGCGSSGVTMPLATSRILAVLMFFLWATSCVDEPVTVNLERDREELGQGSTDSVPQVQRNEATTQNVSMPEYELKKDTDWEVVSAVCTGCHSARLITQQRASKERWRQMIRWMQATQGLWELEPDTEERILRYLARNYSQKEKTRRMPLAPHLMPSKKTHP